MSMRILNRAALWAGLAVVVTSLAGCPKPVSGSSDASADVGIAEPPDAAAPDTGPGLPDASTPDTGPEVVPCSYDDDCAPAERCGENGACMPAIACDTPANCAPSDDTDTPRLYCENATVGLGCRCVKADGATSGYCKRRLPPCAPCETDEQCGTDPLFFRTPLHEPGKCVTLAGAKVCLEPYLDTKCGCGQSTSVDGKYYCAPQGSPATCADGAFLCCTKDANCPPEHPLCDTAHGRCGDLCWYDYEKNETVGCRADKVCHVDPKFLTPDSRNYGAGRCGAPCSLDGDCSSIRGDFVCRSEPASDMRCRPPGCLADLECPTTDATNPYRGYCDRSSGSCVCKDLTCDCRTGTDPVTNLGFTDCKEGFKCEEPTPGAPGQCLEKNCIESGGAQDYCDWNQMCCGEDRDQNPDTDPEACTDTTGAVLGQTGKCYQAPALPWCTACDPQGDVKECMQPTWPTSARGDANLCMPTDSGGICLISCEKSSQCPKAYICNDLPVDCSGDDTVCGDVTRCADTGRKDADGNPIKWCKCTTAGARDAECPLLDPNTADGPHARCSDNTAPGNIPWIHCIWTRACMPQAKACQ